VFACLIFIFIMCWKSYWFLILLFWSDFFSFFIWEFGFQINSDIPWLKNCRLSLIFANTSVWSHAKLRCEISISWLACSCHFIFTSQCIYCTYSTLLSWHELVRCLCSFKRVEVSLRTLSMKIVVVYSMIFCEVIKLKVWVFYRSKNSWKVAFLISTQLGCRLHRV